MLGACRLATSVDAGFVPPNDRLAIARWVADLLSPFSEALEQFKYSSDMLGINPEAAIRRLSVSSGVKPTSTEKQATVAEEVDELLRVGFIREARHPKRVANVTAVNEGSAWNSLI